MKPKRIKIRSVWIGTSVTTSVLIALLAICGATTGQAALSILSPNIDASQALITSAQHEGSFVLYGSSPDPQLKAAADAFQARYGITVRYTRFPGGPMNDRVDTELRAGGLRGDVLIHSDPVKMQEWSNGGVFANLPVVRDFPISNPYHTLIKYDTQGVMYNTQQVNGADLKTWQDVLKPEFKGKIGIIGPRIGFGIAIFYYAMMQDPRYGQAWFDQLAAQKATLTNLTPDAIAPLVAAGEYAVVVVSLESTVPNLKATSPSAPVAFKYLDVTGVVPTEVAINAKAAHPNAAELFVRWMMSREGQIAFNGNHRSSSPLGPLPGTATPPAKSVQRSEPPDAVEKAWNDLNNLFDRLYSNQRS